MLSHSLSTLNQRQVRTIVMGNSAHQPPCPRRWLHVLLRWSLTFRPPLPMSSRQDRNCMSGATPVMKSMNQLVSIHGYNYP